MPERKIILYIAASLDGYIATEDDSLEWLLKTEGEGDNGYGEFYETIDTILIGRRTYDWVIDYEKGNFPYKDKKCYVFSKSLKGKNEFVEFVDENILSFTEKLKAEKGKDIWIVGGGELLYYFVKERLIDRFIITIAPALIGKGIPLFKENDIEMDLELKNVRRFNQFAELQYELKQE
jgi:dihydrofolate reductase